MTSRKPKEGVEGYVPFAQDLISGEMAQKLYFITQKIQKKGTNEREEEEESNLLMVQPGLNSNPALEFVKSVTKVLSLDANVREQVRQLVQVIFL